MAEHIRKKKMIRVDLFTGKLEKQYYGRLLGLINDDEFNSILKSSELKKRVETKETIQLSDITNNHQDIDGFRMVMTVKKVNCKDITEPKLFISERLTFVSYVQPEGSCAFTGESQSYLMVEEEEV
jgi:hypothetical protein